MEPVEIEPTDVRTGPVDDRGRVSVGTEYSGESVRVAVIETVDADDDGAIWYCQYCETGIDADGRPDACPECGVEGSGLSKLDVQSVS